MIYLNDNHVKEIGFNWIKNIRTIEKSVVCMLDNDFAQPVKPYLRYGEKKNRIIAMPAFVGGGIKQAGIKWISSFPDNIKRGLPRAHSVVVLNEADTGVPLGILNSGSISAIRTASVSGLLIDKYIKAKKYKNIKIGIIGFGPIGQYHLDMCGELLKESSVSFHVYDLKGVNINLIKEANKKHVVAVNSWQEAYEDADIFITCTVSNDRYIDLQPKAGSLHLNVSLRDYKAEVFEWFSKAIIVDDWEEICRENTDIENFHLQNNLQKENTKSIVDLIASDVFETFDKNQAIMFNPMGLAAFDISISQNYLRWAKENDIGVSLN